MMKRAGIWYLMNQEDDVRLVICLSKSRCAMIAAVGTVIWFRSYVWWLTTTITLKTTPQALKCWWAQTTDRHHALDTASQCRHIQRALILSSRARSMVDPTGSRWRIQNLSMMMTIRFAYKTTSGDLLGNLPNIPQWIYTDLYVTKLPTWSVA